MSDLINKISSYHFFNYLLPGILFVVLANNFTSYSFIQPDIIIGAFVYYFIGLVISRIGSIIIEPILKKTKTIVFGAYPDYVAASQIDPKLEILSESNNTYRSIIAMLVLLLLLRAYEWLEIIIQPPEYINFYVITLSLLVLFTYSYRKQTKYIFDRINYLLKK